ncbi:MAG: BON domain-containing protein [Acidobacteria bacterium]|nr:BON domain-containing protein [Acidobacteriota bacterium]
MSYEEEQRKRSRVVVETPTARREVVEQQTVRYPPPPERRGYSTGMLATVALVAIAATAIVFLFLTNSGDDSSTEANINIRAGAATQPTPFAQAPIVVQTPLTQPTPIIIQQAPQTVPAPVIIQAPPATDTTAAAPPPTTAAPAAPPASDDVTLQMKIDTAFAADAAVAASTIDATVVNGRVRLAGTVSSDAVKQRAERLAYAVKGVLGVDNRIVVAPATP